jgi:hypothetical protein
MFQESELINLVLALFSFSIISTFFRTQRREYRLFSLGFFLIAAAIVCTVAEGIWLATVFDILEHLCSALAGLMFFLACLHLSRECAGETEQ